MWNLPKTQPKPKDPEKWELKEKTLLARVEDFNPSSPQQVQAYFKAKGYTIPYGRNSGRPSTDEEILLKTMKKHPSDGVLSRIWEARKTKKNASYLTETYTGRDGRIHTEFTYLPDTGRLSSRKPNLQNIPSGKMGSEYEAELATAIRSTMIPTPGMLLLEADWRGIEAALVAFFAQDPDYARICAIDAHSYLASFKVNKPADLAWDDEKLSSFLAKIKKEHPNIREVCKRANHSDGYGIGLNHLAEVLGTTQAGAKEMKELRDRAFPKVAQWKKDVRMLAHRSGRLMNPFGYTRTFFEVYRPKYDKYTGKPMLDEKGRVRMTEGLEANQALAFLPQSTAAAMMRDTLVLLGNHPEHGKLFHLLISIHDSILVECPVEKEAEVRSILKLAMERRFDELGGLFIEIDMKSGTNWGEMH